MTRAGWAIAIVLAAFIAAVAGVFVGRALTTPRPAPSAALHELLHRDLDLDAEQQVELQRIEQQFALRRQAIELEMRADNAKLAAAIEAEHGYGPQVAAAVDASHQAMGDLQKATLAHVFAMRQILRPDQTGTFDRAVVKALTADPR